MQFALIFGIVIAMGAVIFALQNNITVTVTLALWSFNGSLALLLLLALGLGALVAGLLSSPAVIRRQWTVSRLKRQVADLEKRLAEQEKRNIELAADLAARPLPGGFREAPVAPATARTGANNPVP